MRNTIPKTSPDCFNHLVGIPYEDLNCWQLVKQFYSDVLQIGLKHYVERTPDDKQEIKSLIYSNVGEFEKVETPEFGDIVILKIYGIESHIAVFVGEGKILHTTRGVGSCLDRVEKWSRVIVGFYRVRKNSDQG